MIDTESQAAAPRRPPRPRTPPPRPARHANGTTDVVDVAELARQNRLLLKRIEQLERSGGTRFVESAPEPKGESRVADDEELTPWQRQLRKETKPTPADYGGDREPSYNVGLRHFMKPSGAIVELQGDAKNRAYYIDKGYRLLSPDEVTHWLKVERPTVLKLQREKANLINTIRRAVQVDPALAAGLDPSWETDLDHMTAPELQNQLEQIAGMPTVDGRPRRIMQRLPRLQDADTRRAEQETSKLLAGVETETDRDAFLRSLRRAQAAGQVIA